VSLSKALLCRFIDTLATADHSQMISGAWGVINTLPLPASFSAATAKFDSEFASRAQTYAGTLRYSWLSDGVADRSGRVWRENRGDQGCGARRPPVVLMLQRANKRARWTAFRGWAAE
jgi:hypothetical protein